MKELVSVFASVVLFAGIFFGSIFLSPKPTSFPPFFNYPDGFIINANENSKEFWGGTLDLENLYSAKVLNNVFPGNAHEIQILKNKKWSSHSFEFQEFSLTELFQFFWVDISVSLFSFIAGFWFFTYLRDFFFSAFLFSLSGYVLSNFFVFSFGSFYFVSTFFTYFIGFVIFNLGSRLRGKEVQTRWIFPEFLFSLMMGFVSFSQNPESLFAVKVFRLGYVFMLISVSILLILIVNDIRKVYKQRLLTIRKLSLFFSFVIFSSVPVTIFFHDPFHFLQLPRIFFFILFLLFLATFIFATYRYSFLPMQVFFFPTFVSILMLGTLFLFYIIFDTTLSNFLDPEFKELTWVFKILFLSVISINLINFKSRMKNFMEWYARFRGDKLTKALDEIGELLSSPVSMRGTIQTFIRKSKTAINASKITILLPAELFPALDLANGNFMKIPAHSDTWKYFKDITRMTVTSHLAYGIGIRENIYNFLSSQNVQMAIPIFNSNHKNTIQAVILIGEKNDKTSFSVAELNFLKEVTRMASLLLQNYQLLNQEIEKKKIKREISIASLVDNTLNLEEFGKVPHLSLSYFSTPAVGISGDYLDIIALEGKKLAILMGDVAGHGLGTSYLVSAIKAISRDMLHSGETLEKLFVALNEFLSVNYQGNEFMSLFGGIIDPRSSSIQYINAGHLPMLMHNPNGSFQKFQQTQRVLGIFETNYTLLNAPFPVGSKVYFYTDGISELFNEKEQMLGEEGLENWLQTFYAVPISDISQVIQKSIKDFAGRREIVDDMSFLAISHI